MESPLYTITYRDISKCFDEEGKEITKYKQDLLKYRNLDISTLNIAKVDKLLNRCFYCNDVMKAFFIIVNLSMNLSEYEFTDKINNHMSSRINEYITGIDKLNVDKSVGGVIYKSGFKGILNVFIIKTIDKNQDYTIPLFLHEYFIGLKLNELRQYVPNFAYTYARFRCNYIESGVKGICNRDGAGDYIIIEYVRGHTLYQLLKMRMITYKKIYSCIIQLCLALTIAQNKLRFIHRDLHAKNIIIRELQSEKVIKYSINGKNLYLKTDFIATIIDYGLSEIKLPHIDIRLKTDDFNKLYLNEYNVGVDIFKVLSHILTITNDAQLIQEIKNVYSSFGVNDITCDEYYLPTKRSTAVLNINPYDMALRICKLISNAPIIYTDQDVPKELFVIGTDSCDEIINEICK